MKGEGGRGEKGIKKKEEGKRGKGKTQNEGEKKKNYSRDL